MRTNIPYDISKLERVGQNRIILYYLSKLYPDRDVPYPLPERYANVVSDKDIEEVNMGTKNIKLSGLLENVMKRGCGMTTNHIRGI